MMVALRESDYDAFCERRTRTLLSRALNALWNYREMRRALTGQDERVPNAHAQLLNLLNRIQGKPTPPTAPPPPAFEQPNYAGLLGDLMALHNLAPQRRGYAFEDFLKRVFNAFGLLPRGGFRTVGEQIDGSFVLAGETFYWKRKGRTT